MSETAFIAIRRADAPVAIMQFIVRGRGSTLPAGARWEDAQERPGWWRREPTEALIFAEVVRTFPDALAWRRVGFHEIPADRTWREAWIDDGQAIAISIERAREVHRARLREARAPRLAALDVEYLRADEAGDAAAKEAIGREKQRLRDAPRDPRIEQAGSLEQLVAIGLDD